MPKRTAKQDDRTKAASKKPAAKGSNGNVYQLKITLNDVKPPIWRQVQTRDCTLAELDDIIQVSMGWDGGHLHVFEIGGEQYGVPEQWSGPGGWGEQDVSNSRKVKLSHLVAQGVKKFRYVYDMGDNWEHIVQIEKTMPAESGVKYPRCTDGKRACPPEDCGGAWGYGDFLEAISNPKHEQHADMMEWTGGEFDPEAFDLAAVNEQLH